MKFEHKNYGVTFAEIDQITHEFMNASHDDMVDPFIYAPLGKPTITLTKDQYKVIDETKLLKSGEGQ